MSLSRKNSKNYALIDADGNVDEKILNKELPSTIKNALGEPAYKTTETNKDEIARREKKISELQENLKTATGAEKENIDRNINEQQDADRRT